MKKKTIIIGTTIVAVLAAGYLYLKSRNKPKEVSVGTPEAGVLGDINWDDAGGYSYKFSDGTVDYYRGDGKGTGIYAFSKNDHTGETVKRHG